MHNRFWTIILLFVWVSQMPLLALPGGAEPDTLGQDWETMSHNMITTCPRPQLVEDPKCDHWTVWLSPEDLPGLILYQANRPAPRLWFVRFQCKRRKGDGRKYPSQRSSWIEETGEEAPSLHPAGSGNGSTNSGVDDSVYEPQRWGLSPDLSRELPERLHQFWEGYYNCFRTRTHNTGVYAHDYLSALLRLDTNRNYTNIGRATGRPGENIQHFMSNSPWVARRIWDQICEDIKATPGLERGGVAILDESADKKAGGESAGAGRQYNGRLGKVDMSQVGVFLAYANLIHPHRPVWTWVDGELFLQEFWFTPEMAERRRKAGIPDDREFASKVELGWRMIQRAQANGLPFEALICDDLYGRSKWFRDALSGAHIIYMGDVPRNTRVYLEKPVLGVPERKGNRGRKPTRLQVLNKVKSFPVHQVARRDDTTWRRMRVRPTERGELNDPFAARRIWTLREGKEEPVEEWLVIRREAENRYNYALSNAPADASLSDLAWLKCQRYFVERANQDAKSEAGWDELEARKYRGWKHHLALVILATWFVAQVKWDWGQRYARDPSLAQQFELEVLPALSMANIRLLLRAAMPLPQPTPEQAVAQVAETFVKRTRSRKSRLKRQRATYNATGPP